MKPMLIGISNNGKYAIFRLIYKEHNIKFYVDSEDIPLVEGEDLIVRYENTRRINELFLKRILLKSTRQSLATLIMHTDKSNRVYMRDNFINNNQDILDYRKSNLTYNQKEMKKYGNIMRKHIRYRKNDLCNNKLTEDIVKTIRKEYYKKGDTMKELAERYDVSVTAISNIVRYRTWVMKNDTNIRKFDFSSIKQIKLRTYKENIMYSSFKENNSTFQINEILIYYEKLPIDHLIYFEIRNTNNEFICSFDLYFTERKGYHGKENFILGSFCPQKNRKVILKYIELLKYIL